MATDDKTAAERARALRDKIRTHILRSITRGAVLVELDPHVMLGILDDADRIERNASAIAVENIEAEARHRLAEAAAERRALERAADLLEKVDDGYASAFVRALAKEPKPLRFARLER